MTTPPSDNLKTSVLEKIKTGQATMRPKWHFLVTASLAFIGLIASSVLLLFLASLVFFVLYTNGVWFAPEFGFYGLRIFFESLPWALIAMAVACLIIVEALTRRYAFAYQRPLVYSGAIIVSLTVFGGVLLAQSPIHGSLLNRSYDYDMPVTKKIYRDFGMRRLKNVHAGRIVGFTESGMIIVSRQNGTTTVMITPQTRFPEGLDMNEGDMVMILGHMDEGIIQAFGVKKIEPTQRPHPTSGRPHFFPSELQQQN